MAKAKAKKSKAKATKPKVKKAAGKKTASKKAAPKKAAPKKAGAKKAGAKKPSKPADWRTVCTSLAQIRENIDRLDRVIVPLLCERLSFVTQAANFKPSVAGVVVPSRVEQIITSVRAQAQKLGSRPDTIESVYRALIDAFTADEQRHWADLHKQTRLSDKW